MDDIKHCPIWVTGAAGMVGSAVLRAFHRAGYTNVYGTDRAALNLLNYGDVMDHIIEEEPVVIVHCAGVVGGINANATRPVEFLMDNLLMAENLFRAVNTRNSDSRIIFLGSSCIYPRFCPQPIREDFLLMGSLEETNRPYAIAKIAGVEMVRAFNRQDGRNHIALMPTNLYGPGDQYDVSTSHVLPAMIARFHEAKEKELPGVRLWGTGTARREFMYVNDLARIIVNIAARKVHAYDVYNVGSGFEASIQELAYKVAAACGYTGDIVFGGGVGDGTPRKLLDSSRIAPFIDFELTEFDRGLQATVADYRMRFTPTPELDDGVQLNLFDGPGVGSETLG